MKRTAALLTLLLAGCSHSTDRSVTHHTQRMRMHRECAWVIMLHAKPPFRCKWIHERTETP